MAWVTGELTSADMNLYLPQELSSWTPTATSSTGTITSYTSSGRYAKYGDLVIWDATVTIVSAGTGAGYLQIDLPSTAVSTAASIGAGSASVGAAFYLVQVFLTSATLARISRYDDTTIIASGNQIRMHGHYEAA